MKNKTITLILLAVMLALGANAQTALTSTTITNAITVNQQTFAVGSTTGMTAANPVTKLYILDKNQCRGELVNVTAVNSSTNVTVSRGSQFRAPHVAGSYVVIGAAGSNAQSFQSFDPVGSVTSTSTLYTPWINTNNGNQWLASTLTGSWVPGFCNSVNVVGPTADVASAAGVVLPTGPLFTVTGTAAITGFTLPVGFSGGQFCVDPTGAFTWTTATNIALAGTAVVHRLLCFTWNSVTGKWVPSYV